MTRWEGLTEEADTWEPIENLVGCESLIAAFRAARKVAEASNVSARAKRKAEKPAEQEGKADEDSQWKDGAKTKRKAACWKYYMCRYSETQPEKIEDVYCKICGPEFTLVVSGNTSKHAQLVSFLDDSDDEIDEVKELAVPESYAVESDCEFTLYLASPPANMSDNLVH
ncbi:hypothetical protein CYMTET_30989, partial [Cymbomonas tetramitiformis]